MLTAFDILPDLRKVLVEQSVVAGFQDEVVHRRSSRRFLVCLDPVPDIQSLYRFDTCFEV